MNRRNFLGRSMAAAASAMLAGSGVRQTAIAAQAPLPGSAPDPAKIAAGNRLG